LKAPRPNAASTSRQNYCFRIQVSFPFSHPCHGGGTGNIPVNFQELNNFLIT